MTACVKTFSTGGFQITMRSFILTFFLLVLAYLPAAAQTFPLNSTYTLFSTGVDSEYSGTIDLSVALPAGIKASGFFDHLGDDKSYVESTIQMDAVSGLTGVYEVQDTVNSDAAHLVGIGYRQDVGPFGLAGKFFPFACSRSAEFEVSTSVSASVSAATEYIEDAAADADPTGTTTILVRDDTPGTQVSLDGDNVAQRGTNYGAAYVQVVDSSGNFSRADGYLR